MGRGPIAVATEPEPAARSTSTSWIAPNACEAMHQAVKAAISRAG